MVTLAQKEAEIRARVKALNGPEVVSAPTAIREVNRYVGVKAIDGVDQEIIIDIAVHNKGTTNEIAVELGTNKEPIIDPLKQAFIDWFNASKDPNIVAYQEITSANGPGVVVPRVTLAVWVHDPVTDLVTEKKVFAYMDATGSFVWKYMV